MITQTQGIKKTPMQVPEGPADESQPEPTTSRQTSPSKYLCTHTMFYY